MKNISQHIIDNLISQQINNSSGGSNDMGEGGADITAQLAPYATKVDIDNASKKSNNAAIITAIALG